jgi:hypothetical protein
MGINIGGILGGIAGALIPGAGFLAPAIGAGLGTLAGGGSSKNAIKYALLAGGANTAFGIGNALRSTQMGASLGNTLAEAGLANPMKTIAGGGEKKSLLQNPFAQAAVLTAVAGKPEQAPILTGKSEGYDGSTIDRSGFLDNLYASRYDGTRFKTAEERDEYDRNLNESQKITEGMASGGLYARGGQIEGIGGLIEGPGTGTSDDISAMIYQDGKPVQEAMLSNGEVVLSLKDLRNIGGGDAEMAGKMIGDAPNGTRGAVAAKLFRNMQEFKNV